ncbi:hypothetical protein [Methylobacterium sp. R2-1]|uniref:hypothetical protein n=1 Tax=Methylobacterium sp. R2-1 TaxID=2587064 RepID=UPI001621E820|nr:hypothetical protein [Methylobacterium sp. R2-1]MBB2964565.1 hypothetical protein [Methylobacterium sp. R2-1]
MRRTQMLVRLGRAHPKRIGRSLAADPAKGATETRPGTGLVEAHGQEQDERALPVGSEGRQARNVGESRAADEDNSEMNL